MTHLKDVMGEAMPGRGESLGVEADNSHTAIAVTLSYLELEVRRSMGSSGRRGRDTVMTEQPGLMRISSCSLSAGRNSELARPLRKSFIISPPLSHTPSSSFHVP